MSWSAARSVSSRFTAKSLSGSAASGGSLVALAKLSVVETSNITRAGRSARVQIMPDSVSTSPDWTPWVKAGRVLARE